MNYLQQLLEFLDPQKIETAKSVTLIDGKEEQEIHLIESTKSVEGKDLTGGIGKINKKDIPDGIRPKIFKTDKVIDKRTNKDNFKMTYDKKRKCYNVKKIK